MACVPSWTRNCADGTRSVRSENSTIGAGEEFRGSGSWMWRNSGHDSEDRQGASVVLPEVEVFLLSQTSEAIEDTGVEGV